MVLGVASSKAIRKKGRSTLNVASTSFASFQHNLGLTAGSSSSHHIHCFSSLISKTTGHTSSKNLALNPTAILRQQDIEEKDYLARTEAIVIVIILLVLDSLDRLASNPDIRIM